VKKEIQGCNWLFAKIIFGSTLSQQNSDITSWTQLAISSQTESLTTDREP